MSKPVNDIKSAWIRDAKEADYIVVSSRIRLARNLADFTFPASMTMQDSSEIVKQVQGIAAVIADYNFYQLADISDLSKQILVEKHMISPQLACLQGQEAAIIIDDEGSVSIMVNEEDHLRLQCILPGLNLEQCFQAISNADQELEQKLNYAYDSELGYLTSCPTNLGTGMRASVMLHLPALVKTKNIAKAFDTVAKLGFVARGIYGEGTEGLGHMFQISNQITLGRTEEDIIASLSSLVKQLVDHELNARDYLEENFLIDLEDSVGRAWGLLSGARKISAEEAMKLLSKLRLGAERKLVVDIKPADLNKLMLDIQIGSLQQLVHERLDANQRDIIRATILRQRLKQ